MKDELKGHLRARATVVHDGDVMESSKLRAGDIEREDPDGFAGSVIQRILCS